MGARAGARGGSDPVRTTRGPPWPVSRAPAARAPPAGSPGLAPLRGPAAAARRAPGGRGQAVRAGVRAMRGQEIPDRRPRPSAVRHPPRARALHPETCVPDGRMRLRPAALAVSEPLVLRASWGARLGARTYGVRTARLRTFLDAPLACLDTLQGVVQHVHFGHVWRRSSSQAGAAAPVSGSKNRSRHAPQDCPCDYVHPRTRVDAGAAPESFSVSTPPLGVRRTRFL